MPPPGYTSLNIEYVFRVLYELATNSHLYIGEFKPILLVLWQIVMVVGYVLSAGALFIIAYSIMQIFEIRRREVLMYGSLPKPSDEIPLGNPRWQQVLEYLSSTNQNDWRQAIIEADIMLGEILTRQGYKGETIGEQLKQVEPSDFDTLNDAWEAHKVRNEIAHAGSAFAISDTLAKRTIARYGNVFHEFRFI